MSAMEQDHPTTEKTVSRPYKCPYPSCGRAFSRLEHQVSCLPLFALRLLLLRTVLSSTFMLFASLLHPFLPADLLHFVRSFVSAPWCIYLRPRFQHDSARHPPSRHPHYHTPQHDCVAVLLYGSTATTAPITCHVFCALTPLIMDGWMVAPASTPRHGTHVLDVFGAFRCSLLRSPMFFFLYCFSHRVLRRSSR
jgi:hypothetical protein